MKVEILSESINEQKINWNKVQVVQYINLSIKRIIVLTDGNSTESSFSGTVIYSEEDTSVVGEYSHRYSKELFSPITSCLTLNFTNNP